MKRITIAVMAALAVGWIGVASANMIQNPNFSATTPTPPNGANGLQVGWGGQFVDNWSGAGYTIWYPSADSAVNGCARTQYHSGSGGNCSTLNAVGTAVPGVGNTNGTFVALDGVYNSNGTPNSLQGSMQQTVSGLTAGHTYSLSFYWGTSQEKQASSAQPSHDQYLQVSLGGSSQNTNTSSTLWGYFTGDGCQVTGTSACAWNYTTMTFKASSASELLQFLSFGLPSDGPPMILLTGLSMTESVPEPSSLGMFGGGLLGLGLLTLFVRRRALRKQGLAGGDIA